MAIQSFFPTLIYYDRLAPQRLHSLNKELVKECYQVAAEDLEGRRWSDKNYPGGYTSYGSLAQMHQMSSTFAKLQGWLDKHVAKFAKRLDFDLNEERKLEMTGCWINIVPKHTYHSLHLHPISTISGTYYVNTPEDGGDFRIEDPRLSKMMAQPPRKTRARSDNQSFVRFKPETGKVILFESWLRHEVLQNQSDEDRISISFNYSWF